LIATMAAANRTWGEERIAGQLLLKIEIPISPRFGAPRINFMIPISETHIRRAEPAVCCINNLTLLDVAE